ncbi:MAG: LOG family protein [Rhodoblastus sp.]
MTKSDNQRPSSAAQLASPSYRLPALDQDFLLSTRQRGLRFQLEYEKADEILSDWKVNSTLVCFGSARVREDGPPRHAAWYAGAREFGRIASLEGGAIRASAGCGCENVIATGGGPGLMEAANRGAHDVGAPSIGFNITLPHEQAPNPWTTPDLTFRFHYFAMRKMHLAMRANALVAFPGGFGTLDELFEVVTLRQTGKGRDIPIILYDEEYWRDVVNFERMLRDGVIGPQDMRVIDFANSAQETWNKIAAADKSTSWQD